MEDHVQSSIHRETDVSDTDVRDGLIFETGVTATNYYKC
jgi:hypothetical protein